MLNLRKKEVNKKEYKMFIGFYKPSVFVTYLGAISASIGIYLAFHKVINWALVCLMISGVCDGFDGKIARKCKRDDNEKKFGIQIDSLADMVSFVFLPVAICYGMGLDSTINVIIYTLYILAGVIRLGYFNVMAEDIKKGAVTYYSGMPVTSASIVFPIIYLSKFIYSNQVFLNTYSLSMLFVAVLFVLNFKLKKPSKVWVYIFVLFALIMGTLLYIF